MCSSDLRRLTPLALKAAFVVGNVVFATLAARGAWRHRRRAWELLPVWLWPAYFLLANVPMFVEPRYGLALVPFLAVLAAAP